MVTALGVAWVLDGLEVTIASNVGPDLTLKSTLNMSAGAVADIATWYLIGQVIGALFFGQLSDKLGRKNLFMVVRTIMARLEGGGFQLQPFLVIGIIPATRDILTVGAELSLVGEQTLLVRMMTELGVNAGVVVALFIALVLVRRFARLDRA